MIDGIIGKGGLYVNDSYSNEKEEKGFYENAAECPDFWSGMNGILCHSRSASGAG